MSRVATGVDRLGLDEVREALRLLGVADVPVARVPAQRALRDVLRRDGTVRSTVDGAPPAARVAYLRLVADGPAAVEELLGRGWWGHGRLPPPLDWLQARALVLVGDDGRVHAVTEAREGFADLTLGLTTVATATEAAVRIEGAGCVVVAPAEALDRSLTVAAAGLRAVAPTVAVSPLDADAVTAALRAAGVRLDDGAIVTDPIAPALPGTAEDAVGPRAIRTLLDRAVAERRQVRLRYFASSRGGAATDRVVDPWGFRDDLLRGYCHLRAGERTFAVDRIGHARLLPDAVEHAEA